MKRTEIFAAALMLMIASPATTRGADTPYLAAVREFADRVIAHGHDVYGKRHTPLFVDGLDVRTLEPVEWVYGGAHFDSDKPLRNELAHRRQQVGERWILSNLANQQNLFRTLDGLSTLIGDRRYRVEAERAMDYGMSKLRSRNGLIFWGGHLAYDCGRDVVVMEQPMHELKCHYPYYEMMERVSRRKTGSFIRAFWDAHILDWDSLDMNRHGSGFFWRPPPIRMWNRGGKTPPAVPFVGKGRSFCNTGSDLMLAAAYHYKMHGDRKVLDWAKRLGQRYADARHPQTGLGGYQFSSTPDDRARVQFGPEFGAIASDANLLGPSMSALRYPRMGICQLMLFEMLGERDGASFRDWALDDLRAFAKHGYHAKGNMIYPMFIDGQRIRLDQIKRSGHYHDLENPDKNTKLKPYGAGGTYLWAYAMAYRISGDKSFLRTLRDLGRGNGIGDIAGAPDIGTDCSDADVLLGLLELHRASGSVQTLALARRVGDNILVHRRANGFFLRSKSHRFAKFDTPEPLALLHLHATLAGTRDQLPAAWPSRAFFQCNYLGRGRRTDNDVIYKQRAPR